jgi:threonylcarbamoyladenosine tRNA methylthiotransferase MtaB
MCTRTVAMATFGCKVNQYEGQAIQEQLIRAGLTPWSELRDGADAYIVNTCTVTDAAFREGLRLVRRLSRRNPGALIAVTGCAADSNGDEFRRIGGVAVFGNQDKPGLASYIAGKFEPARGNIFSLGISRFEGHSRAFLKIQDGCDLKCSFCIIPSVRGASQSRDPADASREARRLVEAGYAEIVLTGVHLGSYGKDRTGRSGLAGLIRELLAIDGLARVRLSSIEINEVDDELIELMAAEPWRVCPHLHVPAQSGSDAVLRAMRRRYSTAQFLRTLDRLRERLDEPSFTTDLIVGFPAEAEPQFEETLEFCRRARFSRVHIFPYSPRQGTDAARMPDLPWEVKKDRVHRLEQTAARVSEDYYRRFSGRQVEIVVERDDGGYTERYLRARLASGSPGAGRLVRARAVEAHGSMLVCEPA